MITMYRTQVYGGANVIAVEVTKVTEHFVTLANGQREAKQSTHDCYHESLEVAVVHIVAREQAKIESCERQILKARETIDKARAQLDVK